MNVPVFLFVNAGSDRIESGAWVIAVDPESGRAENGRAGNARGNDSQRSDSATSGPVHFLTLILEGTLRLECVR